MYFKYGEKEIAYLKKKDKTLAKVIDEIGIIKIRVNKKLFENVVYTIIGQQISTKAQETIWARLKEIVLDVTPENINSMNLENLQSIGISFRKSNYIKDFAYKVYKGDFIIEELTNMTDEEIIKVLSSLKGIGAWTAEMLMIFSLERPNILNYGDLAILRGMRMLYGHKEIDKVIFEKYKKRYSPYGTVASLLSMGDFFWCSTIFN